MRYWKSFLSVFSEIMKKHDRPQPGRKEAGKNIIFILKYIELHYATLTLPELSAFLITANDN